VRFAPGGGAAFARALDAALAGRDAERLAKDAGTDPAQLEALATLLAGPDAHEAPASPDGGEPGREVVVLWGERLTAAPNGAAGARALLRIAGALALADTDGAGLLEIPAASNGRGLREAGVLPGAGPGLSELPGDSSAPRDARAIAEGLAAGELSALYLMHGDPLRDLPDRELWQRALAGASTVIAHASFLTESIREHADVVFPAEVYAEKEGTLVHPDGRLQRLRPAIARPGEVRSEWRVLAVLASRLGMELDLPTARALSEQLFGAVPFYAGLTLEEIGGRGVRWQERPAARAFAAPDRELAAPEDTRPAPPLSNAAELAGYRSVWDSQEVEFSPSLEFLFPDRELLRVERPLARAAAAGSPAGALDVVLVDPDRGLGALRR
jgi:NADH-quinone oxidoreductase subunit G